MPERESLAGPTVARRVLRLGQRSGETNRTAGVGPVPVLVDAMGRKVMDLVPGPNDASRLAPGVYFVITPSPSSSPPEGGEVTGREPSELIVCKVVVTK